MSLVPVKRRSSREFEPSLTNRIATVRRLDTANLNFLLQCTEGAASYLCTHGTPEKPFTQSCVLLSEQNLMKTAPDLFFLADSANFQFGPTVPSVLRILGALDHRGKIIPYFVRESFRCSANSTHTWFVIRSEPNLYRRSILCTWTTFLQISYTDKHRRILARILSVEFTWLYMSDSLHCRYHANDPKWRYLRRLLVSIQLLSRAVLLSIFESTSVRTCP